jgi:ubiquinone/menaquinone biosynthesis C-methylase UbiE
LTDKQDIRPAMYQDAYYKGFQEEPRFEKIRHVLASFHAEKVLDVGCGDGDVSVMIQNVLQAREIHGL